MQLDPDQIDKYELDPDVGAVVSGFYQEFNYWSKIQIASLYLQQGRQWITTNDANQSFLATENNRTPITGSCSAILENMLKNSRGDGLICEKIVTAKPNAVVLKVIMAEHCICKDDLSKFLMICHTPTDIIFGQNSGIDTCLITTVDVDKKELVNEPTWVMKMKDEP